MLYQLSYEATHWERGTKYVNIYAVQIWIISYKLHINTTAIRGTIHLALDTFVNIYLRLKEDEKNHNIPYFEIDLFHLKFISIVLINYFCQLFQNSTELLAFSTKLILLFVSFLFLSLHQISTIDNMRQFSLHITHSYSDVLLLSLTCPLPYGGDILWCRY